LVSDFREAREKGEEELRIWASQHLNVEIGLALHNDRWRGADYWLQAKLEGLTLDELLERSEVVTVGIDGGGLDDMLGLAVMGRERDTRRWLLWTHAFISPEGEERRKGNTSVYENFAADGDLSRVETLPDDLDAVVDSVRQA